MRPDHLLPWVVVFSEYSTSCRNFLVILSLLCFKAPFKAAHSGFLAGSKNTKVERVDIVITSVSSRTKKSSQNYNCLLDLKFEPIVF